MFGALSRGKKLLIGGLDLLWGGLLFGSYRVCKPQPPRHNRIPRGVDVLSSGALVAAAWAMRSATPAGRGPLRRFATRMAIGMSIGAVSDALMKISVPAGMASFSLGHIAYVSGILGLSDALGGASPLRRYGALAGWIGLGLLGWALVVHAGPKRGRPLSWAALGYCVLLASTAGAATGLVLQRPRYAPLMIGSTLFVLSDLIIAMRLFNPDLFARIPDSVRGDIVWLTYGPAQALLVNGVLLALGDPLLAPPAPAVG